MYALKRIPVFLLTVWAAVTLNFILPRLMPGSPADAILAKLAYNGPVSPATRASIEAMLGVPDGSVWSQYVSYLSALLHLDFGISYTFFPQEVSTLIAQALPWTIFLIGTTSVIAFFIGTTLGIFAAWWRNGRFDTVATTGSTFLGTVPYFWLALVLLFGLGYTTGWFPTSGAYGPTSSPEFTVDFLFEALYYGVLPALSILITGLAGWVMGMRNNMVNSLGDDYVRFAQANGLRSRTVAIRYAARNAMLPQLTSFGMTLGAVVGGSLLTEMVFSYPGVGFLLFNALTNQDFPLMQALFLIITLSVLTANFIVDLLYGFLDPRTRR